MKSATELLAEMLAIFDDPGMGWEEIHAWLHRAVEDVRGAVEGEAHKYDRNDEAVNKHYVEKCQHGVVHGQCRCPSRNKWVRYVPCGAACQDRARGEGE